MAENEAQEEAQEEVQSEEEDLDLDLEPVRKRGGCGWGYIIAALIIVAALAVLGLNYYKGVQEREAAEQARLLAEQQREIETTRVGKVMLDAVTQVQAGNVDAGLEALKDASRSLAKLSVRIQEAGDDAAGQYLRSQQQKVDEVVQQVETQREALVGLLTEQLQGLAHTISGGRARPTAPAEAEAPAEEQAPEEQAPEQVLPPAETTPPAPVPVPTG